MFFRKAGGVSWLVVFLGNPGREYENTRHNAGFLAADAMEKLTGTAINKLKFHALTGRCTVGNEDVLLMNYKIPAEKVIVVSDETALPIGRLRVRRSGSAGGHNGLKSIISALGGENFPRIRLGVGGKPHEDYDMRDWVLSRVTGQDLDALTDAAQRAAKAAVCYIENGPDRAMNEFNQGK